MAYFIHPKQDSTSLVYGDQIQLDVQLVQLVSRSCLLKTIHSYLMNDSVLDISKHGESHASAINVVLSIATAPAILGKPSDLYGEHSDEEDQRIDLLCLLLRDSHSGQTLITGIQKLSYLIDVYLRKLHQEKSDDKE